MRCCPTFSNVTTARFDCNDVTPVQLYNSGAMPIGLPWHQTTSCSPVYLQGHLHEPHCQHYQQHKVMQTAPLLDVCCSRFTMSYTGTDEHEVRIQELPAVFLTRRLSELVFYDGPNPWQVEASSSNRMPLVQAFDHCLPQRIAADSGCKLPVSCTSLGTKATMAALCPS